MVAGVATLCGAARGKRFRRILLSMGRVTGAIETSTFQYSAMCVNRLGSHTQGKQYSREAGCAWFDDSAPRRPAGRLLSFLVGSADHHWPSSAA